jgi:hypothetical protein
MMSVIKTLVYCDLEATGLKSSGRPRISESSLVAVNMEDVLELYSQIKGISQNAQIKLRVCFEELWTNEQYVCIPWPLFYLKHQR